MITDVVTPPLTPTSDSDIQAGREVLYLEGQAILEAAARLSVDFARAINLLLACQGKVVVTGMGKSGHIASKIAATLASTGTPAFFVHPAELRHGDFGMLDERDLVIALSSTGETPEIRLVLDPIKRLGLKILALTGNTNSTLARYSEVILDVSVEKEACPFNLAPTSSTTAALAMGDAIAMVLMARKNFKVEDFAKSHPGGALGQKLVIVKDIMRSGVSLPTVSLQESYENILAEITKKNLGFAAVCENSGRLLGIITDGDLRRAQVKWHTQAFTKKAGDIMSANPKTISQDSLAVAALKEMEKHSISNLLIVNEVHCPIGVIDLKDLLRAGII